VAESSESGDRMKVPEGVIIRTIKGGTDTLKRILTDLRKYSFSGYVKTVLNGKSASATGYIVLQDGIVALSYYEFVKDDNDRTYIGSRSLKFIWEDSYNPACKIELHTKIDISEIYNLFPDEAMLHGRLKAKRPAAITWAETEEVDESDPLWQEIMEWKDSGYNVQRLEELYRNNREEAEKQVADCRINIRKLKALGELLNNMDTTGFEREALSVKKKLKEPYMVLAAEVELEGLRIAIENGTETTDPSEIWEKKKEKDREEKVEQVYDLILHAGKEDDAKNDEKNIGSK
jgi:hypothetical protein